MKKNLLYFLMLVFSMGVFTACSDDDDVKFPIDKELAGVYKGTLDIVLNKVNVGKDLPKNITIVKASNNSINMELKDFKFGTMDLGTITITNCVLTQSGTTYTFVGSQSLTLPNPIGTCPVVVKGTIADGKTTINLDITVPALSQTVNVTYKGTKLSGSESGEAKISDFAIESDVITEQPVIDEATGKISFKVNEIATTEQLTLTPTFKISEKATVSPASGIALDFSNGKSVVYTVVAENGNVKEYTASVVGSQNLMRFSFEDWDNSDGYDRPLPTDVLATSSEGAAFIAPLIGGAPTYKSEDKKEGNYAIGLITRSYPEPNVLIPAIISGSVFTGKFDLEKMDWTTGEKLECTRFGLPYDKKPVRFMGWYKYTPGATFVDGSDPTNVIEIPNKTDECAIQAILFKVDQDDEVLTGYDVNNSDKRVAVAQLTDGTAKAEYTYFDIPFTYLEGKSYEVGVKYKLAIVCSSSKEGDYFKGATNSTLILDEFEIIGE